MNRKLQLPLQTRQANLAPASINLENRTVDLIWTTGAAVKRYDFWNNETFMEELVVSGADLSRLNAGANLLDTHSDDGVSGVLGIVERAWIDKGSQQGHATVRFSSRAEVEPVWNDVRTGIIKNVSVGYSIDQAERIKAERKGEPDVLRVTRFTPMELSLVAIPADARAQVRSIAQTFPCNLEVSSMTDETATEVEETSPPAVTLLRREHERAKQLGAREALGAERKRISELDDLFSMDLIPRTDFWQGLRSRAIDDGWQIEPTRKYILEVLNSEAEPVFDHENVVADGDMGMNHAPPQIPPSFPARPARSQQPVPAAATWDRRQLGRIEVTRDATETLVQSIEQALLIRGGIITDKKDQQEARERGMAGLTYIEMGRALFEATGQQTRIAGLDKHGVAKAMLNRAGPMTATDFTGILANVATKIAKKGYEQTPTTYQDWCNIAYLPDFKPATIPGLGAFSDLDKVPASGGPYYYGTFGDNYETATLDTYGKLFGISRQALVNDDLSLFARTGIAMGSAAARKVNSLAYAVLTGNQTMTEDSQPLFSTTYHGNYLTSGGTAPTVAALNAAEAAMMVQTSPKQSTDTSVVYLNLSPAHIMVPVSLGATARTLNTAQYDPAATAGTLTPNPWRDRLTVTVDAALGGASGVAWYLAAPKGSMVIDTVTIFFLEGSGGEPYTEEQPQFDSDGISYKVRIDAVARALDYRGLYCNDGNA